MSAGLAPAGTAASFAALARMSGAISGVLLVPGGPRVSLRSRGLRSAASELSGEMAGRKVAAVLQGERRDNFGANRLGDRTARAEAAARRRIDGARRFDGCRHEETPCSCSSYRMQDRFAPINKAGSICGENARGQSCEEVGALIGPTDVEGQAPLLFVMGL